MRCFRSQSSKQWSHMWPQLLWFKWQIKVRKIRWFKNGNYSISQTATLILPLKLHYLHICKLLMLDSCVACIHSGSQLQCLSAVVWILSPHLFTNLPLLLPTRQPCTSCFKLSAWMLNSPTCCYTVELWYKSSTSIFHGTQTIDFQLCWTASALNHFPLTRFIYRSRPLLWASQNPPSTMTLTTSGAWACFVLFFFISHWNVNTTSCCMCPTFSLRVHLMSHSSLPGFILCLCFIYSSFSH